MNKQLILPQLRGCRSSLLGTSHVVILFSILSSRNKLRDICRQYVTTTDDNDDNDNNNNNDNKNDNNSNNNNWCKLSY